MRGGKPLLRQEFCDLPLRASPPDVEASGKNDSTFWWIWFITKGAQRQTTGGGARIVKRWGKEKEIPQRDDGIVRTSCFSAGEACHYNKRSGAEKENRAHMETRITVLFRPYFYCPWNNELALMGL